MTTINPHIKVSNVTQRERQVLYLLAHEYTTDMIAGELFISTHTVISHRKNMMEKLEVKNVAGLIRRAFETNMLRAK